MKIRSIKKILLLLVAMWCGGVYAKYVDHRNVNVDSVETLLKNGSVLSDKELMSAYQILMRGYLGRSTSKHNEYARKALSLSYRLNGLNARESALYHLGLQYYGKADYERAEHYFHHALAVSDSMKRDKRYEQSDIDDNFSQLYGALGNLYNMQDKPLLAIEYYQKALPIFERHGWLQSMCILYHNVGELYLSMGNDDKAKENYRQAVKCGEKSADSLMMMLPRKGLVKIYISEDDYENAMENLEPAFAYFCDHQKEEHDAFLEMLAAKAKVNMMAGHKDLSQAEKYVEKALAYLDEEVSSEVRYDVYSSACMLAMDKGHWKKALEYGLKSVPEKEEETTYSDVGGYEMLANIYMRMGNLDEAGRYIRKLRTMMEQFSTKHYQSGISQMEVMFETVKKQESIEHLTREKHLYFNVSLLVAALLLMIALLFFFLWRGSKLRRESILFKARLDGEVSERMRIARDLHDGLGGILSLLRLKIETDAPKADSLKLLDNSVTELRHVAHNLMPEQLLKSGLKSALSDFIRSIPGAHFHAEINENVLDKEKEIVLYRCAYELINNAIKHSSGDKINILLIQMKDSVMMTIGDNGCGFLLEKEKMGMGIQNIKERISFYHGKMNIITTEGDGTEVNIMLPL